MRTSKGSCKGEKLFPYYTTSHRRFPGMSGRCSPGSSPQSLLLPLFARARVYISLLLSFFFSLPFLFNLPLLFSIVPSGYFEIMTLVDTSDPRRGIRPRITRLPRCVENKREGPIVHQILLIARNREGESEDRSDTPGSPAVSLAIAVSDYSGFFSENF